MKKKIFKTLKLIFGLCVLWFLFSQTHAKEFLYLLKNANYKWFILGVIFYIFGQIISAKKWEIISSYLGFKKTFLDYLNMYFLGMFYNSFLPTNIGGDVVKIVKLNDKSENSGKKALTSVLFDRLSGVAVLIGFIIVGFVVNNIKNSILNILLYCLVLLSILGCFLVFYISKNPNIFHSKFKKYIEILLVPILKKDCLISILAYSIIFHIIVIVIHYFIAKMFNFSITPSYYLLLYPISAIAAALPISVGGIGVKEFAYVYMLKFVGIDTSSALIFSLSFSMIILFSSLLGIIPFCNMKK